MGTQQHDDTAHHKAAQYQPPTPAEYRMMRRIGLIALLAVVAAIAICKIC